MTQQPIVPATNDVARVRALADKILGLEADADLLQKAIGVALGDLVREAMIAALERSRPQR